MRAESLISFSPKWFQIDIRNAPCTVINTFKRTLLMISIDCLDNWTTCSFLTWPSLIKNCLSIFQSGFPSIINSRLISQENCLIRKTKKVQILPINLQYLIGLENSVSNTNRIFIGINPLNREKLHKFEVSLALLSLTSLNIWYKETRVLGFFLLTTSEKYRWVDGLVGGRI